MHLKGNFELKNSSFFFYLGRYCFLIVKYLHFDKVSFENPQRAKKITRYILILVLITVLPSIYLAYRIVAKSIFENNARRFVQEQFQFKNAQVVFRNFKFSDKSKEIDILLIGVPITENAIDSLKGKLSDYNLNGSELIIRQGLDAKQEVDLSQIKASILEEVFYNSDSISRITEPADTRSTMEEELKTLFPDIEYYTISNIVFNNLKSSTKDTVDLVITKLNSPITLSEKQRLKKWLQIKLKADSVRLIVE